MSYFFFNDTATTEIYTLSLHDALPISEEGELRPQLLDRFGLSVEVRTPEDLPSRVEVVRRRDAFDRDPEGFAALWADRKSTRLNSSHANISYAVFCLKKQKSVIP